jgi:hypothetical protein
VLRVAVVATGVAVCLTSAIGLAETPDPAAAEALFRAGREYAEARDWSNACPMFLESNRLDFALGTLMNLAACDDHFGKVASAWGRYREVLDSLPPGDDRRPFVAESVARLERLVPRLRVFLTASAVEGTIVTRDGIELGEASIGADLPVDPGEHSIAVAAPGRFTRHYPVTLAVGQHLTLHAEAGEPIVPKALPTGGGRRTAAWILGGVGVSALSVGALLGVYALSERSASDALCTNGVCRDQAALDRYDGAKSTALETDVALAVGALSLGVSTYFFVTSMTAARPRAITASLRLTSSGIGLTW